MKTVITVLVVVVILLGAAVLIKQRAVQAPVIGPAEELDEYADATAALAAKSNLIRIDNLVPGQAVTRSITVTGEARGPWYFEASFPLEVRTTDGAMLAQAPATAQGEWMTENFVPFTGTVTIPNDKLVTTNIVLVLHKSNASGLPEHDDRIEIPLKLVD
jgi:hypothetical protein